MSAVALMPLMETAVVDLTSDCGTAAEMVARVGRVEFQIAVDAPFDAGGGTSLWQTFW